MTRYRKWIDLGLMLAAVAFWFLAKQMLDQIWDVFRLPQFENLPLQAPALIALVLALLGLIVVRGQSKVINFLDDVANELAKVTWPTSQETVASTGVIIVMVSIAAVILFVFDTMWGTLTRSFLTL